MSAGSGTRRSAYVPELDGIRGLAIAGVMALHFTGAIAASGPIERAVVKVSNYGVWGVDLFFVLSGFLITGILADSKHSAGYLRNFYVRRTLRIFPLYYAVLFVSFVLLPEGLLARFDPEWLDARRLQGWMWPYLTNVYLGSQHGWSIPYFSHFWSLAIEEHFYLVWPFAILLLSRNAAMRACVSIGVLALGLRLWFSATTPDLLYADVLTPCRLDALCCGSWFALSARGEQPVSLDGAKRWAGIVAAAILALSTWNLVRASGAAVVLPLRTSLLAVFFGLFIYVASMPAGWPLVRRGLRAEWLRQLGKYSYGLYVYHGIVSYALHRHSPEAFLMGAIGSHPIAAALQVTLGVALSILLAVLSYEFFEARFLSLKSRFEYAKPLASPLPDAAQPGPARGALWSASMVVLGLFSRWS